VVEHPESRLAFAHIVSGHESMMFSIALHALRDRVMSEELAQARVNTEVITAATRAAEGVNGKC
jgi:hypothetical protein